MIYHFAWLTLGVLESYVHFQYIRSVLTIYLRLCTIDNFFHICAEKYSSIHDQQTQYYSKCLEY